MIIRKCFSANLMFPVGFPYFSKCGYLEFRIFAQRKIKEQIIDPIPHIKSFTPYKIHIRCPIRATSLYCSHHIK